MYFRLLGSLEVSIDDAVVELTSARQRTILAILLLHVGRLVPLDRIVEALWDEDPPATAKGQIHTCISALRRLFREHGHDDLISTSPVGYTMTVPVDSLDIARFEALANHGRALAAEGKSEEAAADLRTALGLWRGSAAADIESALVKTIAIRLDEDQVRVIEECVELELALGRHHELVAELSELVKHHPLREILRAQHMLALYRSGRQADALESFQEIRTILTDELGLDPGDRLTSLQQAILAQDAALDLASEAETAATPPRQPGPLVPRQLPAAVADFTGRSKLLADIIAMLSAPDAPDGQRFLPVACLNGKGGVGKTALALHAAHAVRHLYPDGQIFVALQDADGQPSDPLELVARLLSSLGLPAMSLPDQIEDRVAVYRSWLGDRKILLVLDDVDSASPVLALLPGNPNCGVIITSRNPLTSLPGAQHFDVENLDEDACVELLAKIVGVERLQAEPDAVLRLVRLCDCLPLAVRIVGAKLATRPHWSVEHMVRRITDETRRLDELALGGMGIRATIATSHAGLSDPARHLFIRLSLLGAADFASWVSAPLLDTDIDSADDMLDELVAARLVEVRVDESGSCRFRLHDLVRIYALERLAAEEIAAERTAALRRLLCCWLSLAVDAHRRAYGGSYGLHGSAELWPLPDRVRDQLLVSPLTWFRAERAGLVLAITQAAQVGLDEVCWDLATTSVTLFESDYRVEDWQRTHELALEAVRRAGNLRGEAALLCSLGNLALNGRLAQAPSYLEPALRAFEQLGDLGGQAMALGALGFSDRLSGNYESALARYRQSLAACQATDDLVGEVDALANLGQIHMDRENYGEARRLLDQALVRCRHIKARRISAQTEFRLGELYLGTGDWWRAEQSFRSVLQIVRAEGDLVGEAYALAALGKVRTHQGQHELASADLTAALNLSRHMIGNLVHGRVLLSFAEFCVETRAWERATALASEALAIFSETGPAPLMRARFLEIKARIDEQAGNPTAADAARREALDLTGDADPVLRRMIIGQVRRVDPTGDPASTEVAQLGD
jgi:DNA-binding SARP family transcriptional activator